jgi:predicted house-cleaning noncanonical NTP pyrophosphatase (MazG superfamily)
MKQFETNKKSFQIPENYFNQLEDKLLTETKQFSDKKGFDVPKNYFNDLEERIVSTSIKVNKQGKIRNLWIIVSSVAACLIIVTAFIYPLINSTKELNTAKVDKKVEEDVYESLYDSYLEDEHKKSSNDISLDDLEKYYSDQQLSSNN